MKRFWVKLYHLVVPPICPACRTLMRYDRESDSVLCPTCHEAWERATRAHCARCFMPYFDCRCVRSHMKRVGVAMHVKMVPYQEAGGAHPLPRRLILSLKERNVKKVFDELAGELALGVQNALAASDAVLREAGKEVPPTVITFVPRAKGPVVRTGVDQARELAFALSRALSIPAVAALSRHRGTLSQKKLSAKDRVKNMKGAFRAGECVSHHRVLLVDDIITTGATVGAAAKALYAAGAVEVIAVSLGGSMPTVR